MKISLIKDILIHPKKAFVEITENEKEYFGIALILVGIQIIVGLFQFDNLTNYLVPVTDNSTIGMYSYSILSGSLGSFITAWLILNLSKKLNKTESNFKRVFSAIQFSYIPSLLIGTPVKAIGLMIFSDNFVMGDIFSTMPIIIVTTIPFVIWGIILWIMACKQSLQLDTTNVIAIAILTGIIMIIIFAPISILLNGSPIQEGWFEI